MADSRIEAFKAQFYETFAQDLIVIFTSAIVRRLSNAALQGEIIAYLSQKLPICVLPAPLAEPESEPPEGGDPTSWN